MNAHSRGLRSARRRRPVPAPRMRRDDQEFLPAALAILERPASPIAGALLIAICALATGGIAWCPGSARQTSWPCRGQDPAERPGAHRAAARDGRVRAILARNGDMVREGDVLVELDADEAMADADALRASLVAARAETLRRSTALGIVRDGRARTAPDWPQDIPAAVRQREDAVLAAELGQLDAQTTALDAQREQKLAEVARLEATIEQQKMLSRRSRSAST